MSDGASGSVLDLPFEWIVPFLLLGLWERICDEHELARKVTTDLGDVEAAHPREAYLTLWRMEEEGMVVSEPDGSNARPYRRRYDITELGEAYLKGWANSLARYQEEMDLFMKVYAGDVAQKARG